MTNKFIEAVQGVLVDYLGIEDFETYNNTIIINDKASYLDNLYDISATLEKALIGCSKHCLNLIGEQVDGEIIENLLVLPTPKNSKLTDGLILVYINNNLKITIEVPQIFGKTESNTKMKSKFKEQLKKYRTYGFLKTDGLEQVRDFIMKNFDDTDDEDEDCYLLDFLDDAMDSVLSLGAHLAGTGKKYLSAYLDRGEFTCNLGAVFIDKDTLEIVEIDDVV